MSTTAAASQPAATQPDSSPLSERFSWYRPPPGDYHNWPPIPLSSNANPATVAESPTFLEPFPYKCVGDWFRALGIVAPDPTTIVQPLRSKHDNGKKCCVEGCKFSITEQKERCSVVVDKFLKCLEKLRDTLELFAQSGAKLRTSQLSELYFFCFKAGNVSEEAKTILSAAGNGCFPGHNQLMRVAIRQILDLLKGMEVFEFCGRETAPQLVIFFAIAALLDAFKQGDSEMKVWKMLESGTFTKIAPILKERTAELSTALENARIAKDASLCVEETKAFEGLKEFNKLLTSNNFGTMISW